MTRDVEKYVEGCDLCQRMKNWTEEPAGKLKLSEVPKKTLVTLNSRLHYKINGGSRKGCGAGGM